MKKTNSITAKYQSGEEKEYTSQPGVSANYDYKFNVRLEGDSGVGKTCLYQRMIHNTFTEYYTSRMDVDYEIKTVGINGKIVNLHLIDLAGADKRSSYLKGAAASILVFDVTDMVSFNNLKKHIARVREITSDDILLFLVGTKTDLTDKRVVDFDTAKAFADSYDMPYIEVSAKTGKNVEAVCQELSLMLLDSIKNQASHLASEQGMFGKTNTKSDNKPKPDSTGCTIS